MQLELVALVVQNYDRAIRFFVYVLLFDLVKDEPSLTNAGRAKRWVIVRPAGAVTGILLAQADGDTQRAAAGNQVAGRVGFFLRVDDFNAAYTRMTGAGVVFTTTPRDEDYGRVAVFVDCEGNKWDLLGGLSVDVVQAGVRNSVCRRRDCRRSRGKKRGGHARWSHQSAGA